MPVEIEPPVRSYREMAGWPATMPPRRLLKALEAVERRTQPDQLDPETRQDLLGLAMSQEVNCFPSQDLGPDPPEDGTSAQRYFSSMEYWERLVTLANTQDTHHSIGGLLVWKGEETERRAVFKLLRNPEWMGLNRMLPFMKDMKAMIFESGKAQGRPGLILAQSRWDEEDELRGMEVPPGAPREIQRVLEWHGAAACWWHPAP